MILKKSNHAIKANHILNTSAKSMRIGKSVAPRKVVTLSFCFNDLLRMIWLRHDLLRCNMI